MKEGQWPCAGPREQQGAATLLAEGKTVPVRQPVGGEVARRARGPWKASPECTCRCFACARSLPGGPEGGWKRGGDLSPSSQRRRLRAPDASEAVGAVCRTRSNSVC
jgi:hypothetical protein